MLEELLNFLRFDLINSIVSLRIQALLLKNQSLSNKLGEGFFDSGCLELDLLLQQPPLNNPLQCILSLRMRGKISQDLIANLSLIRY